MDSTEAGDLNNALPFGFKPDGTADFACMSRLTLCFSRIMCPLQLVDGFCPYTKCPNWPG